MLSGLIEKLRDRAGRGFGFGRLRGQSQGKGPAAVLSVTLDGRSMSEAAFGLQEWAERLGYGVDFVPPESYESIVFSQTLTAEVRGALETDVTRAKFGIIRREGETVLVECLNVSTVRSRAGVSFEVPGQSRMACDKIAEALERMAAGRIVPRDGHFTWSARRHLASNPVCAGHAGAGHYG